MSSPSRREDAPTLLLGRPSDIEVLLRAIETGAVRNMRPVAILSPREIDLGQVIRGVKVTGDFADLEDEVAAAKERNAPIRRIVMTPAALAPDVEPEKVLDRARRLGVPVLRMQSMEGATPGVLAPVDIEDLLLRPSHDVDGDSSAASSAASAAWSPAVAARSAARSAAGSRPTTPRRSSCLRIRSWRSIRSRRISPASTARRKSRAISSTSARSSGSPHW